MFTVLCGKLVRAFLIDLDQNEELNVAHQMKHAILKPCVKEI